MNIPLNIGQEEVAVRAPEFDPDEFVVYDESKGPFYTESDQDCVEIRYAKKGIASREGCPTTTLMNVLETAVANHPDGEAMAVQRPCPPAPARGQPSAPADWKVWTYQEYFEEVNAAARAFIELGHEKYDGVAILGFNAPEWFMSLLAANYAGGKSAGIYPSDTPEQVEYKCSLSNSSIVVVDNESSFNKVASVADKLDYLRAIICWEYNGTEDITTSDGRTVRVMTWNDMVELGRGLDGGEVDSRKNDVQAGNVSALVFTSGTTGNPKAVMCSHDNLIYEAYWVLYQGIPHFGEQPQQERLISYLPLSHVAGMMVDIISPIVCTAYKPAWTTVYFARPYDLKVGSIGDRLREVRPTLFLGVPRVWEKIAEKLRAVGAKTTGVKKMLSSWAKSEGLTNQMSRQIGGTGDIGIGFFIADKLVLSKIKEALGLDQAKFTFSGAAPMTEDTLRYFGQLGINVNEVYGMSECTGATTWSTDYCHLWGSIGYAMGCEVRVFKVDEDDINNKVEAEPAQDLFNATEDEQGEVCFRGRHIMMGYLANPKLGEEHVAEIRKKNANTIDAEGYLHSGDKGAVNTQGIFKITGRYKELIIGSGGENIAPVPIEDELKARFPAISNAMMVGNKRKFNVVLITLKAKGATGELSGGDELIDELENDELIGHLHLKTISEAMENEDFIGILTDIIAQVNESPACPSNASRIQKFTILPRDFSVETGELTPSLKTKRSVVEEKNVATIEAMYDESNNSNTYVPYQG